MRFGLAWRAGALYIVFYITEVRQVTLLRFSLPGRDSRHGYLTGTIMRIETSVREDIAYGIVTGGGGGGGRGYFHKDNTVTGWRLQSNEGDRL